MLGCIVLSLGLLDPPDDLGEVVAGLGVQYGLVAGEQALGVGYVLTQGEDRLAVLAPGSLG